MQITIDLEESGSPIKSVTVEAEGHEQLGLVATRAAAVLGIDADELMQNLGTEEVSFEKHERVSDCLRHGRKWCCRRVCVEVHYQSEDPLRRFFNPKQTWQAVHEWACDKLKVAQSVCQDLELLAGGPTGLPLNENVAIGTSQDCKVIWLAKPGPEPNG